MAVAAEINASYPNACQLQSTWHLVRVAVPQSSPATGTIVPNMACGESVKKL